MDRFRGANQCKRRHFKATTDASSHSGITTIARGVCGAIVVLFRLVLTVDRSFTIPHECQSKVALRLDAATCVRCRFVFSVRTGQGYVQRHETMLDGIAAQCCGHFLLTIGSDTATEYFNVSVVIDVSSSGSTKPFAFLFSVQHGVRRR